MSVRATAERVTDRVEDRIEPAREAAAERIDETGEKLRGAVRSAPDVVEGVSERSREAAGRVSERSRETAEDIVGYLEDRFGEETVETWAPRLAFALGGLVIGFLLGWAVRRRRRRRREQPHEGFAQAPRTAPSTGDRSFRAVQNP